MGISAVLVSHRKALTIAVSLDTALHYGRRSAEAETAHVSTHALVAILTVGRKNNQVPFSCLS